MALGGVRRRRSRRRDRKVNNAKDQVQSAFDEEEKRQRELRRREQQRQVFQTTEGQGVMEGATISLGFAGDDEDEDEFFRSATGLTV